MSILECQLPAFTFSSVLNSTDTGFIPGHFFAFVAADYAYDGAVCNSVTGPVVVLFLLIVAAAILLVMILTHLILRQQNATVWLGRQPGFSLLMASRAAMGEAFGTTATAAPAAAAPADDPEAGSGYIAPNHTVAANDDDDDNEQIELVPTTQLDQEIAMILEEMGDDEHD